MQQKLNPSEVKALEKFSEAFKSAQDRGKDLIIIVGMNAFKAASYLKSALEKTGMDPNGLDYVEAQMYSFNNLKKAPKGQVVLCQNLNPDDVDKVKAELNPCHVIDLQP